MDDVPLVAMRRSLHALAEGVVSPLRVQATGNEIALQVRPEGFGTPDLPGGGWVGTAGTQLVRVGADGDAKAIAITSLRAAARFVGLDEAAAAALPDDTLEVHAGAALILADVWANGDEALRGLLDGASPADEPAPINLWPEHFDIATELGAGETRATYGISPGDDDHTEPYAYVAPWTAPAETGSATFWNAHGFTGAERPAEDADEILAFFRAARELLTAGGGG
ncbi:hypothetical protein DSM104299_01632 [Baekduia alba]|uniref:hypothetical protein n=1 Tax=Baekduia alba TaxID=2997333 RepID=UPI00233FC04F|nr:hypothetical protein [Baekduia alba]WCB92932.1 hypothetical protein DSM104299_01632 [Baekduia alba]